MLRFNADGPKGLIDRKAPGKVAKLNGGQRRALAAIVESGPIPAIHGVWCAGASRTLHTGYSKSSAYRWMRPPWAGN